MNAQQLLLHSVSRNALPNPEPLPPHQLWKYLSPKYSSPSLLPLPNSPEPNPELQTYSTSPCSTSDFSHHATQIHAISPSATAAPTPRLKHPARIITSIQALSSGRVARRGASRLGRLKGKESASANSDVRRTTKVSLVGKLSRADI